MFVLNEYNINDCVVVVVVVVDDYRDGDTNSQNTLSCTVPFPIYQMHIHFSNEWHDDEHETPCHQRNYLVFCILRYKTISIVRIPDHFEIENSTKTQNKTREKNAHKIHTRTHTRNTSYTGCALAHTHSEMQKKSFVASN